MKQHNSARQLLISFFASALFLMFFSSSIKAADVPLKIQVAIIVKILNYDSNSASRVQTINVVIDNSSASEKTELKSAFNSIAGVKIAGKPVEIKFIAPDEISNSQGVLYLPSKSSKATLAIAIKIAESKKIPLFAGNRGMTEKGAAVSIDLKNEKPQIVINAKQSMKMGMKLASQLLKLSEII
ncbi:MAG: YfiR family protein [Deltaproteobacteria bacterium]|nr:YfiR family protein [Deltaproteobacteria bacterium]